MEANTIKPGYQAVLMIQQYQAKVSLDQEANPREELWAAMNQNR